MKKSTLIAAALMLLTLAATAQNQVDKQGRRQGHWIRTDKDGTKLFEATYIDGLEVGTSIYYYPDGTIRIRNTFTEPGRRCMHEAYDERGRMLAMGEYCQRNRDGQWKFFAEDGRLVKEAEYRMGIKEGRHVVYNKQGDTAEVAYWRNNHRHGRWWKRIGSHGYITGQYVDGSMEGRLVEFDDQGKMAREGYYEKGLKHGTYRYFEDGRLAVDERWHHGMMSDRKILLLTPEAQFVSIYDIACLAAQGKGRVIVLLNDGTRLTAQESADVVYDRLGNERFTLANRKSRILVARDNVQGIGRDKEGRDILLMDPQPDFAIFPDEDCVKMVNAKQYDDNSPLDAER